MCSNLYFVYMCVGRVNLIIFYMVIVIFNLYRMMEFNKIWKL
jgi:hypothetical protein